MTRRSREIAIAIAAASFVAGLDVRAAEPPPVSLSAETPPATPAAPPPTSAAPTSAAPTLAAPVPVPAASAPLAPASTPGVAEPPPALAPPAPVEEEKFGDKEPDIPEAERRSGFLVGLSLGLGPGASNGYPNNPKKIGRTAYYTESGVGAGSYGALWIGGALADAFSFGVGFGGGGISAGETMSPAGGVLFHVDTYPLFPLGKRWRDLGVALEAGTGSATTVDAKDDQIVFIDGAGAGYVSGAVFFEAFELWKLRSGPFVGGHYMFSETVRRPLLLVGFRTVLYTGP